MPRKSEKTEEERSKILRNEDKTLQKFEVLLDHILEGRLHFFSCKESPRRYLHR
jgi:hypothetical protein